jgi:hypothetical protein
MNGGTVKETAESNRANPITDNESVSIPNVVNLRADLKLHQVREADFTS